MLNRKIILSTMGLIMTLVLMLGSGVAIASTKLEKDAAIIDGCLRCHGAQGLNVKLGGKKLSLYVNEAEYRASMHGTNACTSCHTDITDYPHVGAAKGDKLRQLVLNNCQKCHDNINKVFLKSAHGKRLAAGQDTAYCRDCHGKHNIRKPQDPKSMVYKNNLPHTCTKCHSHEVKESYEESFHGKAVILGSKKAASCVDCHGSHEIIAQNDPNSPVAKVNVPRTCAKCHAKPYANFAEGREHFVLQRGTPGEPMYWTLKFFVWLTIFVIAFLIIHMQLELYRKYKNLQAEKQKRQF